MSITEQRQHQLAERIYSILFINDKPNYTLTTDQFMQLLFIQDELSKYPLLNGVQEVTEVK
jgi:hypothetical protein